MKPKRISPEQYVTLASLKMPVYSSSYEFDNEGDNAHLIRSLIDEWIQHDEHQSYGMYTRTMHCFWTLVDSDES